MEQINIRDLVPRFIWDDTNGHALAKAIEAACNYCNRIIAASEKWMYDVDSMPEAVLDERLWELGLTPAESTNASTKRAILKARYIIGQDNGTEAALLACFKGIDPKASYETDAHSVKILLTAESMTAATYTNAMNTAQNVVPAYVNSITCTAAQTMAMYLNAACMVDDVTYDKKPVIMDGMKSVVHSAVQAVFPTVTLKLNGTSIGSASYDKKGLYEWTMDFTGNVTSVTVEDANGVEIASRTMKASYAKDAYAVKVVQHWNDPTAEEGSMRMNDVKHEPILNAMALSLQLARPKMRIQCRLADGSAVDLNVNGVLRTDDVFTVSADLPTGDDALTSIESMMMYDTDGHVYAMATPMDATAKGSCAYRDSVRFVFDFHTNRIIEEA